MRGLFVTATDTGAGKTVVSAILAAALRARGIPATYRKPLGCGGIRVRGRLVSEDAVFVRRAAGLEEPEEALNPICLATPAAPTVALRAERRRLSRAAVVAACGVSFVALPSPLAPLPGGEGKNLTSQARRKENSPPSPMGRGGAGGEVPAKTKQPFVVVEGIGGLLVPILPGFLVSDLAADLGLPLVVVARATLGTINHTLLTVEAARRRSLDVLGVVVSGMPRNSARAEAEAPREIAREGRVRILGVLPILPAPAFRSPRALLRACSGRLDWKPLLCAATPNPALSRARVARSAG